MTPGAPTAVVLAAGEGQRLAPLTNRRPKPMLPVANRPLLEYVVDAIATAGIDEIVLVVGYERDRIQTHFGDGDDWDVSISYAIQETQLGTGHAVLQAEEHVDGPFVVLNGDRIIEPSAVAAVHDAARDDEETVLAVTRTEEPSRYGVVTLDGEYVTGLVEKPRAETTPSEIINAGIYGFQPDVFDEIRATPAGADGELSLPATIDRMGSDGDVRAVRYDGRWLDVTHLWDLLAVNGRVLDRDGGRAGEQVSEGAQVSESAHVDPQATVGPNSVVGRGTTVAENARIQANATVERSVVFPDATVAAGAVVRDCIVAENATVGPNATVGGGAGTVVVDGEVHENVRLGGVVGDNAHVRAGAVLEPGAVLHDGATVGEGAVASGSIDRGTTIRRG